MSETHHLYEHTSAKDVPWESLSFTERAVLCFVFEGERVLLIHKKRGLGKGKINAPGGRIEPGETALEAAVRETQEEVGLIPINPQECARLHFLFTDGYSLHGTVFRAFSYEGTLRETEEAIPLWSPVSSIPYDRMWEDDRLWIPHLLEGRYVEGFFIFDGDTMLDAHVVTGAILPPPR
ncbi:8-oxo-dGTP diphosphatase [Spirochaeta thermophila]|uniref:Oxidized purine nucleoside triphosphate hydrolase n=1 Tax=Winmispira thermophila (strain ATCC 49972 / DSM 6192 / RI 19.B1) TaxID=665571 RepID=E0RSH3_WINT6|nr:8-oxo-dGTP diphosphatase [Spirochaeta thermophila]ADN01960.1 mutator protein MutT [Spirochaeta thermophila DSM 6192]